MRARLRRVAACLAAALCGAVPAAAQEPQGKGGLVKRGIPVELSADSLEYEAGRDVYVARGDVHIRQGPRELSADWVAFSRKTRRGVASGDVVFTDGVDTVRTRFVEFDVDTLEGVLFDAEFDLPSQHLRLRGEEVARTGPRTYRFRGGQFTSCRCPDPDARVPWEVDAEKADLEIEGYGTARNTTVEILGVPVVWLPWMIYPLKTERQSGLLFPEIAVSGRNGAEIGLPVFWAAGDPVNVIVTPRWLSKRGGKADVDVEYVLGRRSGGENFASFIWDFDISPDSLETPFDRPRWAARGAHDFFLPDGWRARTRYAFASDNAHPNDFDDLRSHRVDRFLPAEAFGGRDFGPSGSLGFVAGARYADDLQSPDDSDRDEFLLQRLPEASFTVLPTPLPFAQWLAPALDVEYTWFQQLGRPQDEYAADAGTLLKVGEGVFFDTGIDGLPSSAEQGREGDELPLGDPNQDDVGLGGTENDDLFQEGELLADDGHRAVFHPRLGLPFRIADLVELYPEVGWHETLYGSDALGFERRGYLTGRVDARTRLRGSFGDLVHLVEPRLGWAFVSGDSSAGDPVFVPATAVPQQRIRELALENVTRDPADRVERFNGLSFGVGNRLYRRPAEAGGAASVLADFALLALYDFEADAWGDLLLDGRAYPLQRTEARFVFGFDPERGRVDEALAGVSWGDERGDRVAFDYRYVRDIPSFFEAFPRQNDRFRNFRTGIDAVNQISGALRVAIDRYWALTYRTAWTFERNLFLVNEVGVEYASRCDCWAMRVELRESRGRGFTVGVSYRILGLGDDSRAPFDQIGSGRDFGLLDAP